MTQPGCGLREDLAWMGNLLPNEMPCAWHDDMTELIDYWQAGASRWTGLIKRAVTRHCTQERVMGRVHQLHQRIFETLQEGNAQFDHPPDQHSDHAVLLRCHCGQRFATNRGLQAHKRRKHQMYSPEHPYLAGTQCQYCMTEFWSTQRLQQHLAYIPKKVGYNRCFQALQASGMTFDYERQEAPPQFRGLNRVDAVPVYGPFLPMPDPIADEIAKLQTIIEDHQRRLQSYEFPADAAVKAEALADILTKATQQFARHEWATGGWEVRDAAGALGDKWLGLLVRFPEIYHGWAAYVFITWGNTLMQDLQESLHDGYMEQIIEDAYASIAPDLEYYQLTEEIAQMRRRRWDLSQQQQDPGKPHRPAKDLRQPAQLRRTGPQAFPSLYADHPRWQEKLKQCKMTQLPDEAFATFVQQPRQQRAFYVVHLFSGRRRANDLRDWLVHLGGQVGLTIHVLSMDTAVDMTTGDLRQCGPNWELLLRLYKEQHVLATVCGPPCETYTEARHTEPPPGIKWPRPLRSASALFGLSGLTGRELVQLEFGSLFCLQCLHVLALHMCGGGMFLMEHPAAPLDETRASIWRSQRSSRLC